MDEVKFKELINYKYNNKYNLDNIWYRTRTYPIHVKCPIHDLFTIRPSLFLNIRGCPICKDTPLKVVEIKIKYPDYTKYLKEDTSFLYCVKLINKRTKESFYKIGVTSKNIYTRLSVKYFEVLPILMYVEDSTRVYNLEQELHSLLKEYSYRPEFIPNGVTECYSIDIDIPTLFFNLVYK